MRSLRGKMVFLTTCITVLAVIVVALTSVLAIPEYRKSEQLLLLLCETGERNLDYYFNSVEKSVRKLLSYVEKDMDGLEEEQLQAHMDRVSRYFDEIANKTNGVLTYYYRIDPEVSETVKGFWYTNLDGSGFTEHVVTDISRYDTQDTSHLVWFTVPKFTGNGIWLPPYITENLDVRVISYNVPVYYRGRFVGVIGIELDYTMMAEQVESIRLYNNGYAFLTDSQGKLIFHPRIDLVSMTEEEKPTVPDEILTESSFVTYHYDGAEKEAVWLRLTNGMRLYVSVPKDETEEDWSQLVERILLSAGAVLLVSVVLTLIFTGQIIRPLKQLTEAARQADQGNYDFRLDYQGRDEVGALTRTFKNMADHMKEHITDLNKRAYVDALTSVRNKGAFTKYIDEMQAGLNKEQGTPEFAIGVFDCDDLKTINDQYGHDKGDIYLKTASRLICQVFQHSPVFRTGGDEFAVVLRNNDYEIRQELIDAFESTMAEINEKAENGWEQAYVAMGLAVFDPAQDHSVIDTLRRADKTMYINKRKHKDDR